MQKVCSSFVALLWLALTSAASAQSLPGNASLRYSEQVSNNTGSGCGCFTLHGTAADAFWKIGLPHMGLAIDAGVENTGSVNGAGYGLTLSTFTAGPRIGMPVKKTQSFIQALFGLAHGSGSNFPQSGNTLTHSANSFAFDIGAGADYPLNKRLSARLIQIDYLRTALPNNTTNWQNNLRISAGLTLRLSH